MNASDGRRRLAVELAVITLVVTATVVAVMYLVASPGFDHAVEERAESARTNFIAFSMWLSVLATAAAWVVWLRWRRRAGLDTQPDGPGQLLAVGVAALPPDRQEWGEALMAELASIEDRGERWRFAASGARTTFGSPAGWERPAAGWAGAAIGAVGVMACVAAAIHLLAVDAGQADVTPGYVVVTLVLLLAACLVLLVAAPAALTSNRLARHIGVSLGVATGVVLLVTSRSGTLDEGALTIIGPAQLVTFVVAPAVVAAITRSLQAAVQCIVWSFVFSAITMLPVYIIESIGRYRDHGELFLDADAAATYALSDNLTDAVSWLVLIGPGLLIPLGVLVAAAVATITSTLAPTDRPTLGSRPSSQPPGTPESA
jgi:hypothetical protein